MVFLRVSKHLKPHWNNYFSLRACLYSDNKVKKTKSPGGKYKDTINLPKTEFVLSLKKQKNEDIVKKRLELSDLYKWQQHEDRQKQFVLHDGPPYANGRLHVGHAINKVLKDIINRYYLLRGYKIHYVPGWDCHGLPIELKALTKNRKQKMTDVSIRAVSKTFAEDSLQVQKEGFQDYGVMADWEGQYYTTMDPQYEAKQLDVFYRMFEKGLVYQGYMPVYWSPSSRTALAEAELEYNPDFISKAVYVKFPVVVDSLNRFSSLRDETKVFALIWTTTPWTLPANEAICYGAGLIYCLVQDPVNNEVYICEKGFVDQLHSLLNKKLNIINEFKGTAMKEFKYINPLKEIMNPTHDAKVLPFLEGGHVTADVGTGLVHTAPAHGHEDFQKGLEYGLPVDTLVDEAGRYTPETGPHLEGKRIHVDAEDTVISLLKDYILLQEDYKHSYPIDWRTKKPVILRASKQWFIDTSKLQDQALECMKDVEVYPDSLRQNMDTQLKRRYWCISRQRVWGVPIPVFYHRDTDQILINREIFNHVQDLISKHGSDCWWNMSTEELLPEEILSKSGLGSAASYRRGSDIIDIWFDSGTSWASVLPDDKVADVYLEGLDQFRGWFQSSLLTSVAYRGKAPFKKLVVHGFAVDEEGHKMAKSVGNVVDPGEINKGVSKTTGIPYGLDVLRLWVANSGLQTKVAIGSNILDIHQQELFQIRKMLRYLLGTLQRFDSSIHSINYNDLLPQDQYMLSLLYTYGSQVTSMYEEFKFGRVLILLQKILSDLSKFYITITKDRLYCDNVQDIRHQSCQFVLYHTLETLTKSIAPILPSLAEEVYKFHPEKKTTPLFHTKWYTMQPNWNNPAVEELISNALVIRDHINENLVSEPPGNYDVLVVAENPLYKELQKLQQAETLTDSPLCEILQTAVTRLISSPSEEINPTEEARDIHSVHSEEIKPMDYARVIHSVLSDSQSSQEEARVIHGVHSDSKCSFTVVLTKARYSRCERCWRNTADNNNLCQRCSDVLSHSKDSLKV
ncbi:isoleucine--tRNA ligase, mitochondrial-like [Saccostrea echinata]|uniref:isoleucine--tRNA ligase, mitochondrial-like n=1 Tax=Saccostrea echinata TaxID=191078 RepID=UPI002A8305D7|nr:isoleucine--tRNA ligase, mitochondrial-like [Saccostrea echinata]